jgi:hypothetical protein
MLEQLAVFAISSGLASFWMISKLHHSYSPHLWQEENMEDHPRSIGRAADLSTSMRPPVKTVSSLFKTLKEGNNM